MLTAVSCLTLLWDRSGRHPPPPPRFPRCLSRLAGHHTDQGGGYKSCQPTWPVAWRAGRVKRSTNTACEALTAAVLPVQPKLGARSSGVRSTAWSFSFRGVRAVDWTPERLETPGRWLLFSRTILTLNMIRDNITSHIHTCIIFVNNSFFPARAATSAGAPMTAPCSGFTTPTEERLYQWTVVSAGCLHQDNGPATSTHRYSLPLWYRTTYTFFRPNIDNHHAFQ